MTPGYFSDSSGTTCPCKMEKGKLVGLCRMHRAYFRQAREMEMAALEGLDEAGPEPSPKRRSVKPMPATDAIGLVGLGAALGAIWRLSPDDALWPYLVAPVAVFLGVMGVLNLAFNRKR